MILSYLAQLEPFQKYLFDLTTWYSIKIEFLGNKSVHFCVSGCREGEGGNNVRDNQYFL